MSRPRGWSPLRPTFVAFAGDQKVRRLAASAAAGMFVVLVVAAVLVSARPSSDDESSVLAGDGVAEATTTTTSAVPITTLTTPTTSTSLITLPTSSVPSIPVSLPLPVVTLPRPTVPTPTTPVTRVQGAASCGREDANGERAVHYGAVAPTGRIIATLTEGDIALSDDLGATWTFRCNAMRSDGGQAQYVVRMTALADDVIWAQLMATASERPFVRSLDGGQTWTNVDAPRPGMRVYGASFVSATTVFAWGMMEDNSRVLFRTVDGASWSEVTTANSEPVGDAVFLDSNNGWMTTRSSPEDTVYATRDGGATWQKSATPAVAQVLDIDAYDADHVYLAAGLQDGRRAVVSTSDGGQTWQVTEVPTTPVVVAAIDDRAAVLVAQSTPIWHTLDGGATWTRVTTPAVDPYSPRFADAAGGRYAVVPSASTLAVTDDGSRTWRRVIIRAR